MRSGPAYTDPTPVVIGRVVVDSTGVELPIVAINSERSIGGAGMPSEITGGGQSRGGKVSVELAPAGWRTGTTTRPGTPWRPEEGLPLPAGTRVSVYMGEEDGGDHPVMKGGVVLSEEGSMKGSMNMTIVDTLDELSTLVSWNYLRSAMPPAQSAPSAYHDELIRCGLSHWSLLERAFRASGNGTTMPDPSPNTPGLTVPLVDTAWPEKGTCYRAQSYNDPDLQAGFTSDAMGTRVVTDASLVYAPSAPVTGASRYVSMRVSKAHSGPVAVRLTLEGGTITVRVTGTRVVEVYSSRGPDQHTQQLGPEDEWVHVRFSTDGSTNIRSASVNTIGSIAFSGLTGGVSEVSVGVYPGGRINGLLVTGTYHVNELLAWTPRARYSVSTTISALLTDARRVHDEDALKYITDVVDSACLGFWRDVDGVFRVTSSDSLPMGPSRKLFTPDNTTGLSWKRERYSARRHVRLRMRRPVSGSRLVPTHLVWSGSGETLARGHSSVEVYKVPEDQEVILCTEVHKVGQPIGSTVWGNPDKGQGTLMGGWLPQSNDWATVEIDSTLEANPAAGVYTFTSATVVAQMDPGDEVALVTAPADHPTTGLPSWRREQPVPQAGSWIRCEWVDAHYSTADPVLNPALPELVHDTQTYVQTGAASLASYLQSRLVPTGPTNPGLVILEDIEIRPEWRLEEGDVVTIEDSAWMELRLTALVTGTRRTVAAGYAKMYVTLQVLEGVSLAYTYDDADRHYQQAGREYGELDGLALDYAELSNNPIR